MRTNDEKKDSLQVKAFQMLFKLRVKEHGPNLAFASAIADTSDKIFGRANKEQVQEWCDKYAERVKK